VCAHKSSAHFSTSGRFIAGAHASRRHRVKVVRIVFQPLDLRVHRAGVRYLCVPAHTPPPTSHLDLRRVHCRCTALLCQLMHYQQHGHCSILNAVVPALPTCRHVLLQHRARKITQAGGASGEAPVFNALLKGTQQSINEGKTSEYMFIKALHLSARSS